MDRARPGSASAWQRRISSFAGAGPHPAERHPGKCAGFEGATAMPIERWQVTNDGVTHRFVVDFEIVADCTDLCPVCGNACTGTIRVWYPRGPKRLTVQTDRSSWDSLFNHYVQDAMDRGQYSNLPSFLRERNEMTGWCAMDVMDGAMISPDEVLTAIASIQSMKTLLPPQSLKFMEALQDLATHAIQGGHSLWAWDD